MTKNEKIATTVVGAWFVFLMLGLVVGLALWIAEVA